MTDAQFPEAITSTSQVAGQDQSITKASSSAAVAPNLSIEATGETTRSHEGLIVELPKLVQAESVPFDPWKEQDQTSHASSGPEIRSIVDSADWTQFEANFETMSSTVNSSDASSWAMAGYSDARESSWEHVCSVSTSDREQGRNSGRVGLPAQDSIPGEPLAPK